MERERSRAIVIGDGASSIAWLLPPVLTGRQFRSATLSAKGQWNRGTFGERRAGTDNMSVVVVYTCHSCGSHVRIDAGSLRPDVAAIAPGRWAVRQWLDGGCPRIAALCPRCFIEAPAVWCGRSA